MIRTCRHANSIRTTPMFREFTPAVLIRATGRCGVIWATSVRATGARASLEVGAEGFVDVVRATSPPACRTAPFIVRPMSGRDFIGAAAMLSADTRGCVRAALLVRPQGRRSPVNAAPEVTDLAVLEIDLGAALEVGTRRRLLLLLVRATPINCFLARDLGTVPTLRTLLRRLPVQTTAEPEQQQSGALIGFPFLTQNNYNHKSQQLISNLRRPLSNH